MTLRSTGMSSDILILVPEIAVTVPSRGRSAFTFVAEAKIFFFPFLWILPTLLAV